MALMAIKEFGAAIVGFDRMETVAEVFSAMEEE